MGIRALRTNRCRATSRVNGVIGLAQCRSDRSRHDHQFSLSISSAGILSGGDRAAGLRSKVHLVVPHRPDRPRQFVRDRDGRFVMATPRSHRDGPLLEPSGSVRRGPHRSLSREQHGAGAMRQEATQIYIAAFTDPPQVSPPARGRLAWRQAHQLANCRPRRNAWICGTAPTIAVAVSTPTPGICWSRTATGSVRATCASC